MTLALRLAPLLPPVVLRATGEQLGTLAAVTAPSRAVVSSHLRILSRASGKKPIGVREVFRAYGRYWGEFLALASRPELVRHLVVRVEGLEHLGRAARTGPVCLLTGHIGNWDLAAAWASSYLGGLTVVAESLRPPRLYRLMAEVRSRWNIETIPSRRAEVSLYRRLRQGRHIALVADRPFGRSLRRVACAGAEAWIPDAGMLLARRAGAALIPGFALREMHGYVIRIYPPLDPSGDPASAFGHVLGEVCRDHAEQWCMLHPVLRPSDTGRTSAEGLA
jgi:KDO2-lipid IV(A) lauroyltransferase